MRSFSRTFVLGPGQPGKSPIRVVSDILSLRAYSPLPDIFAQGDQSAPQSAQAAPQDQHQAMILELSKQTGMTPQYSEMCLVQVEWNFDKGLAMFAEKKVSSSHIHAATSRSNLETDTTAARCFRHPAIRNSGCEHGSSEAERHENYTFTRLHNGH